MVGETEVTGRGGEAGGGWGGLGRGPVAGEVGGSVWKQICNPPPKTNNNNKPAWQLDTILGQRKT